MDLGKFVGLGKGGAYWSNDDIWSVAQYSPQLAVAKAMRAPFQPFVLSIENTFSDATTTISNFQNFGSTQNTAGNKLIWPTLVDSVMYEVDSPNLNAGNSLQYLNDYFYGLQSGIRATMLVLGSPKYSVCPDFVPLRMLCDSLNGAWPNGWVLQPNCSVQMQFQQFTAAPALPVTIVVGFRMWQPIDPDGYFANMTTADAKKILTDMGMPAAPPRPPR